VPFRPDSGPVMLQLERDSNRLYVKEPEGVIHEQEEGSPKVHGGAEGGILRRHLVDKVPVSDLCDEYHSSERILHLAEAVHGEPGASLERRRVAERARSCARTRR